MAIRLVHMRVLPGRFVTTEKFRVCKLNGYQACAHEGTI